MLIMGLPRLLKTNHFKITKASGTITGRAAPCAAIAPIPLIPSTSKMARLVRYIVPYAAIKRPSSRQPAFEDKLAGCDEIEQHTGDCRQQQGPFRLAADQRQRRVTKSKFDVLYGCREASSTASSAAFQRVFPLYCTRRSVIALRSQIP
jgi:hypothetical protein